MATKQSIEWMITMATIEQRIVMAGAEKGHWGQMQDVEIRSGGGQTPLGRLIGTVFSHATPAIINYWGFRKRSTGFLALAARLWPIGVRRIRTLVIPFGSIHEDDVRIAAPDLLETWRRYRKAVVKARQEQEAEIAAEAAKEVKAEAAQTTVPQEMLMVTTTV